MTYSMSDIQPLSFRQWIVLAFCCGVGNEVGWWVCWQITGLMRQWGLPW